MPFLGPEISEARKRVGFASGECWSLGDSPVVAMMMAYAPSVEMKSAPRVMADGCYGEGNGKTITVCTGLDYGLLLRDFFAKLQYYFGKEE